MRGRTNAEPNIGVQLNASVDTYEVATGENILAGDFVERYNETSGQLSDLTVTGRNYDYSHTSPRIHKMSNGKYICEKSIINRSQDDVFTLDTTSNINYGYTQKNIPLGNDVVMSIIPTLGYETISSYYRKFTLQASLQKYDSSNNSITTKDISSNGFGEYSTSNYSLSQYRIIPSSRQGIYKGYHLYMQVQNNYWTCNVVTYDVQITGSNYDDYGISVTNVQTYSYGTGAGSSTTPSFTLGYFVRISNSEDYLMDFNVFSNANQAMVVQLNDTTFSKHSRITNCYKSFNEVAESGNVDFYYMVTEGSGSATERYLYRKRVFFSVGTWNYNEYTPELICQWSIGNNPVSWKINYIGTKSNRDIYMMYVLLNGYSPYITPIFIDTINGNMSVGENINILPDAYINSQNYAISEFEGNDIIFILGQYYSSGYTPLYLFEYNNGNFVSKGVSAQKVKGITSQDYIMGVAKQSGNAGDTIAVYIPQVNS